MLTARSALSGTMLGILALSLATSGTLSAQEKPNKNNSESGKSEESRRLPPHYAKVVRPEQREKIYALQESYGPRIADLKAQLGALKAESDAAMRAVLTADQRKQLDALIAAAKQKRESSNQKVPSSNATARASAASDTPATKKAKKSAGG